MLHPHWFWFIQLSCSDKHPAGKYLLGVQRHQVLFGQCAASQFKQSHSLPQAGAIEGITNRARVEKCGKRIGSR